MGFKCKLLLKLVIWPPTEFESFLPIGVCVFILVAVQGTFPSVTFV
jgi:hypothetical protein